MNGEPERLDAPNQQVVRGDASAPWDEGGGGSERTGPPDELDAMTKDELIDEAERRGVEVKSSMTKDEIRAAIDEAEEN